MGIEEKRSKELKKGDYGAGAIVYTVYTMAVRRQIVRTRVFQSGNSQAVRIPKELQFEQLDVEYEIERQGDRITITPVGTHLTDVMALFSAFSDDFMAEGRLEQGDQKREAL